MYPTFRQLFQPRAIEMNHINVDSARLASN